MEKTYKLFVRQTSLPSYSFVRRFLVFFVSLFLDAHIIRIQCVLFAPKARLLSSGTRIKMGIVGPGMKELFLIYSWPVYRAMGKHKSRD